MIHRHWPWPAALGALQLAACAPADPQAPANLPTVNFGAEPAERQHQAAQALSAWMDQAEAGKATPPRVDGPGLAGKLYTAATDKTAFTDAPSGDLDGVMETCVSLAPLTNRYLWLGSGIKPGEVRDLSSLPPAAVEKVNANAALYQTEVSVGSEFLADCLATSFTKLEASYATLPAGGPTPRAREGLAQSRAGVAQFVSGALTNVNETTFTEVNRQRLLNAAARNIPVFAKAMTLSQRTALLAQVDDTLKSAAPTYQAALAQLKTGLSSTTCEGLCRY